MNLHVRVGLLMAQKVDSTRSYPVPVFPRNTATVSMALCAPLFSHGLLLYEKTSQREAQETLQHLNAVGKNKGTNYTSRNFREAYKLIYLNLFGDGDHSRKRMSNA